PWGVVPHRDRGRSDEDCARAPRGRFHRDAPAESVLRGIAEGDARQARIRQRRPRRDPAAGVRRRRRGARVYEGMRPADHRLLLARVRRPRPATPARETSLDGARARAPRREAVDAQGTRQCRPEALARHAPEPTRRAARESGDSRFVRAVVQRVLRASVTIGDRTTGEIEHGLLVFVGVERGDGPADVNYIAGKIRELRVFEDPAEPSRHVNLSIGDVGGSVLVVSQFTLAGDCRKGRRPSFDQAAPPDVARPLYEEVVRELRTAGITTATGEFQATMEVSLVNHAPVTLLLDSRKRF